MDHKDLRTWQVAIELAKSVYSTTLEFPLHERYGMVNQIRRAAVSIPTNIAEGCGRSSDAQLVHFLGIATGSNCELETQLYLAYDIGYISEQELNKFTDEIVQIRRMIIKFSSKYGG